MSVAYKFKITLWDNTGTSRWRGSQTAVIFDAKNIGVEEFANDSGSAYWTLSNDHPQLSKHVPLSTHYEISRWSDVRSRWEFVGAGMLNDYQSTEYETIFNGIDYKAVLNQIYTPLSGQTQDNSSPLNPDMRAVQDELQVTEFVGYVADSTTQTIVYNNNLSVENVSLYPSAISWSVYSNYSDAPTLVKSGTTNGAILLFDLVWGGSTSGVDVTGNVSTWTAWVVASPPGLQNPGQPPLSGNLHGQIGYALRNISNSSSGVNRYRSSYEVRMFPRELYTEDETLSTIVEVNQYFFSKVGASSFDVNLSPIQAEVFNPTRTSTILYPNWINCPLRNGMTYSFTIYGAMHRNVGSALETITIGLSPMTTGQVTIGANSRITTGTIISNVITQAITSDSRIAWATMTTIGSSTKTYDSYSAGEPVLNYIANLCDIEMGSKTDESRVVFGIDRPSGSSSYNGNFKLNLSVSSSATTAIALKYPENIKTFGFNPGYSKVRNDITVIPYGRYYTGTTGNNVEGVSIIGSAASDSASVSTYGRIPLIVTKSGYIDSAIASAEAARLLTAYSSDNTRNVNLVITLNSVDIWNGWDLGESVGVKIKSGLVDIDEPFVISGARWFGESNGVERLELELVQGSKFNSTRV